MNLPRALAIIAMVVAAQAAPPDPEAIIAALKTRGVEVALLPAPKDPAKDLAAHYASGNGGSSLGGNDIYLFPDGRYLYIEWGCFVFHEIYDRGTWSYRDGLVHLRTEYSSPDALFLETSFLPLISPGGPHPLRLLGTHFRYEHLFENPESNADFPYNFYTNRFTELITPEAGPALYDELKKNSDAASAAASGSPTPKPSSAQSSPAAN